MVYLPQNTTWQVTTVFSDEETLEIGNAPDALLTGLVQLLWEVSGSTCCLLWQAEANGTIRMREISPVTFPSEPLLALCRKAIPNYLTLLHQGQTIALSQRQPFLQVSNQPGIELDSLHSILLIPLLYQQSYLGGICLAYSQQEYQWQEPILKKIRILTAQCAATLYQIQLSLELASQGRNKSGVKQTGEFLSHMTHELRTPLTGILGFARMLRDEIYGKLNPKQKQYVGGIVTSGEHLLELVNDFLDLSKIDAQREELFLEKIPVEDLCLASFSIVQAKAEETGLELRLEIAPQVDFCRVDQRRIKQILVNLLSNAIKFTEVGSIVLKVKREGNQLAFSVIDTGIGIKAADLDQLFQPFGQLNNRLNRKHKGTGLGLVLSRQLARLHGGDLTVTSQEGQGSCFTLWLPV